MTRGLAILVLLLGWLGAARPAGAHVGSPDVFYEADAGAYHLFVTVRVPQVIPGVATIEIRASAASAASVQAITVVPMRLTGPGSRLPPTPDVAVRSPDDAQLYTASVWLMERGSMQVRVEVTGARGSGALAVPVPAVALQTMTMDRGLGMLLFGLMALLALSLVSIVGGALGESTLAPGAPPRSPRRRRVATAVTGVVVLGLLAFGNRWWTAAADDYAATVYRPWQVEATVRGCTLTIPTKARVVMPDHGHDMHLFLVRTPALDVLAHLHPSRPDSGPFTQVLPPLPAGHYQVFADLVMPSGFPVTGTGTLDLPALACPAVTGDDTTWTGAAPGEASAELGAGGHMIWDRPAELRAGVALALRFRVVDPAGAPAADLGPYMGMAAHAEIVRTDMTVFAHVHPDGSVAMPALELAREGLGGDMAGMPGMVMPAAAGAPPTTIAPVLTFPYGFPQAGDYRVFVQIKRAGQIQTAAFTARVRPADAR